MPRIILEAEESSAVPRRPYPQIVRVESRAMAMSMHIIRGGHTVEEKLKKRG